MLAAVNAELFSDPKFWVGAAFIIFLLFLIIKGVPGMIIKALDARADEIRKELDEARRLHEDAKSLLAEYQHKAQQAENEAKSIIEKAKREAEALAAENWKDLQDKVARRSKQAEEKIARAEEQATNEVRNAAIEKAVAASEHIFKGKLVGDQANQLIDNSIEDLRSQVN